MLTFRTNLTVDFSFLEDKIIDELIGKAKLLAN